VMAFMTRQVRERSATRLCGSSARVRATSGDRHGQVLTQRNVKKLPRRLRAAPGRPTIVYVGSHRARQRHLVMRWGALVLPPLRVRRGSGSGPLPTDSTVTTSGRWAGTTHANTS
jgi:hypothetical protein